MAAMGQGQAAQGGEGAAQAQQSQGEGQGGQGPDLSSLAEQIGGINTNTSMEEMRQIVQGLTPQQQQAVQEAQEGGEEIDLSWLDQEMAADPQAAAQRFNEVLNASIDQRAQQLLAPVQKQMVAERHEREAEKLGAKYPELATPEMAKKIAGQGGLAEQRAQEFEHRLGIPGLAQKLASEPAWWEDTFMRYKAAEAANSEGSGDPGAAHLENGGGPGPSSVSEADLVKAIVNAGNDGGLGSRVLDF